MNKPSPTLEARNPALGSRVSAPDTWNSGSGSADIIAATTMKTAWGPCGDPTIAAKQPQGSVGSDRFVAVELQDGLLVGPRQCHWRQFVPDTALPIGVPEKGSSEN
ncbi:hypothetical protein [Streptomyces atratus]|uniref:hypothetical protein n=1 Tax=Streptomyces atratus TaxID=1893 RepID=UPI001160FB0A|nr:hypothetical protein [Streptomyces atratus]